MYLHVRRDTARRYAESLASGTEVMLAVVQSRLDDRLGGEERSACILGVLTIAQTLLQRGCSSSNSSLTAVLEQFGTSQCAGRVRWWHNLCFWWTAGVRQQQEVGENLMLERSVQHIRDIFHCAFLLVLLPMCSLQSC